MTSAFSERSSSLDEIASLLTGARKVVTTTHVTPDGDGLGSALALMRFMRARGKEARLINCSATPDNLRFMVRPGEFNVWTPRKHERFLKEADVILATDIGGTTRLGKMEAPIRKAAAKKVVIDHHIYENDFFDAALIDRRASSSAEIVYDLIRHMDGDMGLDLALPLYVGLVSDTGNFCYTSTSARAHRIAAELLECGVDPHRVWKSLSCGVSWPKMKVLGLCLSSIEQESEGRIVWTSVKVDFLKKHGLPARDAFEVVNYFLLIEKVEAGVFLMEISPTRTKVSLRSAGRVDVCSIAARHGGGGHRFAAGCTVDGMSMQAAREMVLEELESQLAALESQP